MRGKGRRALIGSCLYTCVSLWPNKTTKSGCYATRFKLSLMFDKSLCCSWDETPLLHYSSAECYIHWCNEPSLLIERLGTIALRSVFSEWHDSLLYSIGGLPSELH